MLYDYCKECDIPYKKIGKLIVATRSSEIPKLNALMDRGLQNGVDGLKMMEGCEAKSLEPELQCVKALLSSASGIVDTHSLMLSFLVRHVTALSNTILLYVFFTKFLKTCMKLIMFKKK